ncbi:MAG: lycopene cyclase family protein [Saprospiraceae bacterium]
MRKYDFIIAGGGCAGLSLVLEMLGHASLRDKKILIIDNAPKAANDRTWCFWTRDPGAYRSMLTHSWEEVHFSGPGGMQRTNPIAPYTYCMVRSSEFYAFAHNKISHAPNVEFLYGHISGIQGDKVCGRAWVNDECYVAPWVFNSCHSISELLEQAPSDALWQHFRGWWVKATAAVFSPNTATLMDFRTPQLQGGHFLYLLPLNAHEALVEYTVFSTELMPRDHYDGALERYLGQTVPIGPYTVQEEEHGVIPMFSLARPSKGGLRIVEIGTLGGAVKPTTGYAFLRIQAQARALARQLAAGRTPEVPSYPARFRFYDGLLLHLLQTRGSEAARIFDALFQRNPFPRILRFLDEQSRVDEEAAIFSTLPWGLFLTALWEKHFAGLRANVAPSLSWNKTSSP